MNKAFVKESEDDTAPKCPVCHAIGSPVGAQTLADHLKPGAAAHLTPASAHYCPNPTCDVAYFDGNNQRVEAPLLLRPTWPKSRDPGAVLCECLKITAADILSDAQRKDPTRVRKIIEHAKAHPAECSKRTPDARPCVAEAQQLYLKNTVKK